MEYNKFEEHLRKTFNKQEEAVDVSKIMSGVIAAEKKSYRTLYLGLALLFAVTASSGYMLYSFNNEEINQIEENDFSNHLNASSISSEKILTDVEKTKMDVITRDTESESNKLSIKAVVDNSASVIQEEKSSLKELKNKSQYSSKYISQNELVNIVESNSSQNFMASINETSKKIEEESVNNITFDPTSLQKTPLEISFLTTLDAEKLQRNSEFANLTFPDLVECPKFSKNPWIFEIGTIMGVSNPVKRFSINPEEINPALTSRAENEKSLEGLDLEFYLSAKRTRWPVFVKSGLAYSRWTEQMNLERNYTEIDTVQGIISATVSQNGDTLTYIYGDIFIEKDIEIKRKVHYYINRISVPISLVYEKEFGKYNAFQAELGASFNISTFSVGSLYESEDTFTNVNVGDFFKTLTGVSYFSKLHYRRYITNHAFIGTLGHFHYLPSEFSRQTSFSQKYINYGLSVYAGYRF